jgi:glycosyltransferase involved in cell wall biosynthesis
MPPSTLSIIIPTYNRARLLEETLTYLAAQTAAARCEVIVADDGSTDDTARVVRSYESRLRIVHAWKERAPGARWNAARPRNQGLARVSSDAVTFLDCGMLVAPDFVEAVLRSVGDPRGVLLHPILGASATEDDLRQLGSLSPETLAQVLRGLQHSPAWRDGRDNLFLHVDDEPDLLPASWTLGWGAALTVSTALAREVGGYDAAFDGWGAEDQDFAYRLRRAGASFRIARDAPTLHLPHPTVPSQEHRATMRVNRRKVHQRHYSFETELYPLYPGRYYNQVLARWSHFVPGDVLPHYGDEVARQVLRMTEGLERSLLVGSDQLSLIELLNPSDVFVTSERAARQLRRPPARRSVHHLLGCDTPFADGTFDVAVVTDFIRVLYGRVLEAFCGEVNRIARRTLVIFTPEFVSRLHSYDGLPWASVEQVSEMAKKVGADWACAEALDGHELFWMSRPSAGGASAR